MEFDVNNVYTAANADDLHKGDFCVFADVLGTLKERVKDEIGGADILSYIREEDKSLRFVSDCNNCYELAYLVCPVRNFDAFEAWRKGKAVEVSFDGGKTWVLWKRENKDKIPYNTPDWCAADYRPVVEQPKEKKYRPFKNCKELCDFWYKKTAVNVPSYAMPLIWVKSKNDTDMIRLITGFNQYSVMIEDECLTLTELSKAYTFLDGTPCGVVE